METVRSRGCVGVRTRGQWRREAGVRSWLWGAPQALVLALCLLISACATPGAQLLSPPAPGTGQLEAAALLESLPVKGRAPMTGYDRKQFGQAWSDDVTVDFGHNGCDTRNDILRRDLGHAEIKPGTHGCVVLRGILDDPYTGTRIEFQRGAKTSRAVQIDHVVALGNAWATGAQQLDDATRRNLANDPLNLQATDGPTNQKKRAGDAATWMPPNRRYWCEYVTRQITVKARYHLWVTQPEKDALERGLATCTTS